MMSLIEFFRMTDILKVMNYVYLHPESKESQEKNVRKKFKREWEAFSQFTLGGSDPLVHPVVGPENYNGLKLTQKGVREFHALSHRRNQLIISTGMIIVSTMSVIVTILVGLGII